MQYLHTMVRVTDLDASIDFYVNKLGLREVNRYEVEAGRFTLVFLAAPQDEKDFEGQNVPMIELTHNWDEKDVAAGATSATLPMR